MRQKTKTARQTAPSPLLLRTSPSGWGRQTNLTLLHVTRMTISRLFFIRPAVPVALEHRFDPVKHVWRDIDNPFE